MFKSNLHSIDRVLRIVVGIVLLSLVFVGPKTLFGLIGIIFLVTAFISFCPAYRLLNFSTCSKK